MLDLSKCNILESKTAPVASSVTSIEEGSPLVWSLENGVSVVSLSAGTSGEKFAGVAMGAMVNPTLGKSVVSFTIPASSPYTVVFDKTPVGTPGVWIEGTKAAAGSSADQYAISGATLTFHADNAGETGQIVFNYTLTVSEMLALYGNQPVVADYGIGAHIGLITTGLVVTDKFDPSVDFSTIGATVKTGASGLFVGSGNGATVDCVIGMTPNSNDGWLGLHLHP